jgi:hypothetical protein
MADEKQEKGWSFGLEDALKVGAGVALGIAGLKYATSGTSAPAAAPAEKKAGSPARRKKKRGSPKKVALAPDPNAAPRVPSAYERFVKAEMPKHMQRGRTAQQAMKQIAVDWKAKK